MLIGQSSISDNDGPSHRKKQIKRNRPTASSKPQSQQQNQGPRALETLNRDDKNTHSLMVLGSFTDDKMVMSYDSAQYENGILPVKIGNVESKMSRMDEITKVLPPIRPILLQENEYVVHDEQELQQIAKKLF